MKGRERRSGRDRRVADLPPPEGQERRTARRDRRGNHRAARIREAGAWALAVVGVALAAYGVNLASDATGDAERAAAVAAEATASAKETADRLADQAAEEARTNALASFQGCQRTNRETKPAARAGLLVLRDLVVAVNDGAGDGLPPAFVGAPARLEDALRKLAPTDCPAAYPNGYIVWIEEGRPAP